MPRRKDSTLHASLAKDQVLEAFKLIRADFLQAQEDQTRVGGRVADLKIKHDQLRNAAIQLGIHPDNLGDDLLDN